MQAVFFRTAAGNEPVREWLKGLGRPLMTEIGTDIRVVEYRWPIGPPLVDNLGKGLWEVRSTCSDTNEYRIIFCVADGKLFLLHGFNKKTRRTPLEDLAVAQKRKRELDQARVEEARAREKPKRKS